MYSWMTRGKDGSDFWILNNGLDMMKRWGKWKKVMYQKLFYFLEADLECDDVVWLSVSSSSSMVCIQWRRIKFMWYFAPICAKWSVWRKQFEVFLRRLLRIDVGWGDYLIFLTIKVSACTNVRMYSRITASMIGAGTVDPCGIPRRTGDNWCPFTLFLSLSITG